MDQDRRRERPDDERGQNQIDTGYWTNEPAFQKARQRAREYKDEELHHDRRARGPYDAFENDEYYANRGWTRSAAVKTSRDWAFYNNQDFSRADRLEINFDRDSPEREMGQKRTAEDSAASVSDAREAPGT